MNCDRGQVDNLISIKVLRNVQELEFFHTHVSWRSARRHTRSRFVVAVRGNRGCSAHLAIGLGIDAEHRAAHGASTRTGLTAATAVVARRPWQSVGRPGQFLSDLSSHLPSPTVVIQGNWP